MYRDIPQPPRTSQFMDNEKAIEQAFARNEMDAALDDYNQFQTKIFTSVRGGGKTFRIQKRLLNRYFKRGKFFAVLRESQIEVDNMMTAGFWDNNLISQPPYNKHEYTTKGNKIIVNNIVVGIAIALTTYGNFRGTALNLGGEAVKKKDEKRLLEQVDEAEKFVKNNIKNLTTIFFDEFEPITPKLSTEKRYQAYLHICETLFRFRDNVEAWLCGNIENSYNVFLQKFNFPDLYNLSYGIKKTYTKPDRRGKIQPLAVWVHMQANKEWENLREASYIGKIERGRDAGMFTTGNAYKGNQFKKIPNKPLKRSASFNITDGENTLTVWTTENPTISYITERTRGNSYITYCFDIKLAVVGVRLIRKQLAENLIRAFERDELQFDSSKSFSIFLNLLPSRNKL